MYNSDEDLIEAGVSFKTKTASQLKSKRFNGKLKIYREFALATLSALTVERKHNLDKGGIPSHFYALDAYSCTGLAAIQWKKHLQGDVHVTAADHDDIRLIQQNAERNFLRSQPWQLDPIRVPGDPKTAQTDNEIFTCQADARPLMAMEAFQFIYLSPYKNSSTCLEPAFHSLASEGVLNLVVPDLSIFARAPHVVQRAFSAQVIKTEYLKEMAARTVLAEAARAAAKYSKGISALYVVSQDDYLLITVQVHRGQRAVDGSLNNVSHLLHCRFCEERVFLPNQLAPHDDPYSFLTCTCKSKNLGKTAVILGPMWKDSIFNTDFLSRITKEGNKLGLSAKFSEMASLLLTESMCSSGAAGKTISDSQGKPQKSSGMSYGNTESDGKIPTCNLSEPAEPTKQTEEIKNTSDQPVVVHALGKETLRCAEDMDSHRKRKADLSKEESPAKRQRKDYVEDTKQQNVPFYYNVSRSKKGVAHKLNKLVLLLQNNNHQASRTHFDPCAIRTSASVSQFVQMLD
ncbi:tRNA (guanine(26)-N(2))-dimethyltransferase [Elysia marginata]|uniref:tRNA (guanine(26)-N(2))-dimethyltransferase n=1 Tax=Elysia marginata TaxID=1093978 RepID=A0AAV4HJR2_9GAST|nr:tRNA (guanine(26)-N(2))-dimethyltransferase [Elysia marginata]